MNMKNITKLVAGVIVLALLAVRVIRRRKLLHTCGGDCAHCAGGCRTRERR